MGKTFLRGLLLRRKVVAPDLGGCSCASGLQGVRDENDGVNVEGDSVHALPTPAVDGINDNSNGVALEVANKAWPDLAVDYLGQRIGAPYDTLATRIYDGD